MVVPRQQLAPPNSSTCNSSHLDSSIKSTLQGRLLPSTKETTLPTGPPTFRRAEAALEMAGPAAAVALDRPSEALEAAEEADWLALLAASEVEEECLTTVRRVRNCDCRSTARVAAGILGTAREGEGADVKIQAQVTRGSRLWRDVEVQWRIQSGATKGPESADLKSGTSGKVGHVNGMGAACKHSFVSFL